MLDNMEEKLTELEKFLKEQTILKEEYYEIAHDHQTFDDHKTWVKCRDMIIRWIDNRDPTKDWLVKEDEKEGLEDKKFSYVTAELIRCNHDYYGDWTKYPLVIREMKQNNLNIKDLKEKVYSNKELQKAIAFVQKEIDLYKNGITGCKNFIEMNYYGNFMKDLEVLVRKY